MMPSSMDLGLFLHTNMKMALKDLLLEHPIPGLQVQKGILFFCVKWFHNYLYGRQLITESLLSP